MDFSHIAHKNVIASAVIALVVLCAGFYNHYAESSPSAISYKNANDAARKTTIQGSTTVDITNRDSDKDGIADWEERLSGTDPFRADTDGDGTVDGIEVASRRDPLKPGPNDVISPAKEPNFATSSTDLAGIKKEFYAKYLATASRDIRETTFRDLLKGFDKKKFTSTNELVDLSVISDESPTALRAYGNAFGVIINKYTAHTMRTEEEVLTEGMKTKDDASLRDLQLLAIDYKNFSHDLRALPVPLPLAPHHLKIVNGYDGMSRGLLGMEHLFSDPINGAAGYETYTRMRLEMITGYAGVVSYLGGQHIVFTADEPGYPFYGYDGRAKN